MRRLLTGYAVSFNFAHYRTAHLFQNRYKSIVCDKGSYLLELVRYIHLNPIRAGLVKTLADLDRYPWSGHAVVIGNREFEGQEVKEVLERFGENLGKARERYRQFIADGILMDRREELVGMGVKQRRMKEGGQGEKPSIPGSSGTRAFRNVF